MIETGGLTFGIRTLASVTPDAGRVRLAFSDGPPVWLDPNSVGFEHHRVIAANAGGQARLGLAVDESGRVAELNRATTSLVAILNNTLDLIGLERATLTFGDPSTIEYPAGVPPQGRTEVGFWASAAVCYLCADHPDYDRILSTLAHARRTKSPVWFATFPDPVEGDDFPWFKVLDVRPHDDTPSDDRN